MMCHKWQTKVRGISVCGRSVYATDCGLKLGYKGPLVPTDLFLADLRPDLADSILTAMTAITEYHQKRLAAEAAASPPAAGAGGGIWDDSGDDSEDEDDFDDDDCEDDHGDNC